MHSEIYTTHLRAQSYILNGEKTESPLKSKYVKLLKQFPQKKKSSSWSKTKFKSKITKSKSSKTKPKIEKKANTKTNRDLESQKNIIIQQEKECINDIKESNNNNYCSIDNNNIKNIYMNQSTDFHKKDLNLNYFREINENEVIFYKTFQNNNLNNYIKKKKYFNDIKTFKNYFNIYKLRKQATSARDKIRNNYFKNNYNPKFNIQKSSTYLKAIKLKEEIQNSNKNINFPYTYTYTSILTNNLSNDEKNIMNEINKLNNTINNKENNVTEDINKNTYINTYNYQDIENINYHFFDKSIKMPKKIKKYSNNSNSKRQYIDISLSTNIFNSQLSKNKNKKNSFRKKANNTLDNYNRNINNNINYTNSEIFAKKNKKEILNYKNINDMNLISPENLKLNTLIKKMSCNRKFKDKSFDLMNYIFKLEKHKVKSNSLYNISEYNNRIKSIYPANEYNPFLKIKSSFK